MPEEATDGILALNFQEVLTAIVRLRSNRPRVDDAETFRSNTLGALRAAEQQSRSAGYTGNHFKTALLAIVGFLDESIFASRNPAFGDWARRPLTEEIFNHNRAGDVFFENLSGLLKQSNASSHADVLEIYQLCLLLGFGGRYSGNAGELRAFRAATADKIQQIRGKTAGFSEDWRPRLQIEHRSQRDPWLRPVAYMALACALLVLFLFVAFTISLRSGASQLASTTPQTIARL